MCIIANGAAQVDSQSQHALAVGDRAHRIVGRLLEASPLPCDRLERAAAILKAGQEVLTEHPVKFRSRAVLAEACGAAASYLHHFQLGDEWTFVAAELPMTAGRVDLVFMHASGRYLIDELKFGMSRDAMASVHTQIDRYLHGGAQRWGSRFLGVRMCAVAAPLASRLYVPGAVRFEPLENAAAIKLEGRYG